MKLTTTTILAALCVALVNSVPVPEGEGFQSQALDRLMMVEADNEAALRSKRTIGILRQLFPDISKIIEDKVNMVVGEIIRIVGPVVIKQIFGGAAGAAGGTNKDGSTVTLSEDDFGDDDDFFSKPVDEGMRVPLNLPSSTSGKEPLSTPTTSTAKPSRIVSAISEYDIEQNDVKKV